jgi:aspartyl-tRNA(Asn)/glutamyl-tRNA(Gln) amidotransferase subunit A
MCSRRAGRRCAARGVDPAGPWNDDARHCSPRESGAVLLGKTCTPNLAGKGDRQRSHRHHRSPWNLERTPGSSGAYPRSSPRGLNQLAVGTDGGGSIRIPCSLAGVSGIKALRPRAGWPLADGNRRAHPADGASSPTSR